MMCPGLKLIGVLYRSIGMLLGYHLQWSSVARVIGNEEQKERWEKTFMETNAFVGGMHFISSVC